VLATWREHAGGASHFGRGAEMARNRVDVIRNLLERADAAHLPQWLKRQALAAAYYCAAILALHDPSVPAARYMYASLQTRPWWRGPVAAQRRRTWRLIVFCLGFPLTRPLRKLYPRVDEGPGERSAAR